MISVCPPDTEASISRRAVLRTGGAAATAGVGLSTARSVRAAEEPERPENGTLTKESETKVTVSYPDGRELTLTYDESLIRQYQPQFILEGVSPEPLAFHALHAESNESTLNAVYGFTFYSYQEGGAGRADSHLGDHEPVIVWYDQSDGSVFRVDYAGYHWFRAAAPADAFQYADDGSSTRPMLRVEKTYHHYYIYSGSFPGDQIQTENLLSSIDGWLSNGFDESLALTQPYDPWDILGRESWWRHNSGNLFRAFFKGLWFNLGLSSARQTSDLSEVNTWSW